MAVEIRIVPKDGAPDVVIPDAVPVADLFFSLDPSSRDSEGSYDSQAGGPPINAIRSEDVDVLNGSMRARTPKAKWADLFAQDQLDWLAGISPEWDLIDMPEEVWQDSGCLAQAESAVFGILAPYRNVSVATKMLHYKRPRFFPVLDRLVVEQLGIRISNQASRGTRARQVRVAIEFVRELGRANQEALIAVSEHLNAVGRPRPLVRILDALTWTSHPAALTFPALDIVDRWTQAELLS